MTSAPFSAPPGAAQATFLTGAAAAAGLALVNSVGNAAGFLAPYGIGRPA